MSTELNLDAIKARADKATAGPWHEIRDTDGILLVRSRAGCTRDLIRSLEDVAALIAEVERLRVPPASSPDLGHVRQDIDVLTEQWSLAPWLPEWTARTHDRLHAIVTEVERLRAEVGELKTCRNPGCKVAYHASTVCPACGDGRRELLDEMVRIAVDTGLYEATEADA
jgi:hypothetical protein